MHGLRCTLTANQPLLQALLHHMHAPPPFPTCPRMVPYPHSPTLPLSLPQEKSYFALHLPHGWWVFGLDLALVDDIDMCQYRWGRGVIMHLLSPLVVL